MARRDRRSTGNDLDRPHLVGRDRSGEGLAMRLDVDRPIQPDAERLAGDVADDDVVVARCRDIATERRAQRHGEAGCRIVDELVGEECFRSRRVGRVVRQPGVAAAGDHGSRRRSVDDRDLPGLAGARRRRHRGAMRHHLRGGDVLQFSRRGGRDVHCQREGVGSQGRCEDAQRPGRGIEVRILRDWGAAPDVRRMDLRQEIRADGRQTLATERDVVGEGLAVEGDRPVLVACRRAFEQHPRFGPLRGRRAGRFARNRRAALRVDATLGKRDLESAGRTADDQPDAARAADVGAECRQRSGAAKLIGDVFALLGVGRRSGKLGTDPRVTGGMCEGRSIDDLQRPDVAGDRRAGEGQRRVGELGSGGQRPGLDDAGRLHNAVLQVEPETIGIDDPEVAPGRRHRVARRRRLQAVGIVDARHVGPGAQAGSDLRQRIGGFDDVAVGLAIDGQGPGVTGHDRTVEIERRIGVIAVRIDLGIGRRAVDRVAAQHLRLDLEGVGIAMDAVAAALDHGIGRIGRVDQRVVGGRGAEADITNIRVVEGKPVAVAGVFEALPVDAGAGRAFANRARREDEVARGMLVDRDIEVVVDPFRNSGRIAVVPVQPVRYPDDIIAGFGEVVLEKIVEPGRAALSALPRLRPAAAGREQLMPACRQHLVEAQLRAPYLRVAAFEAVVDVEGRLDAGRRGRPHVIGDSEAVVVEFPGAHPLDRQMRHAGVEEIHVGEIAPGRKACRLGVEEGMVLAIRFKDRRSEIRLDLGHDDRRGVDAAARRKHGIEPASHRLEAGQRATVAGDRRANRVTVGVVGKPAFDAQRPYFAEAHLAAQGDGSGLEVGREGRRDAPGRTRRAGRRSDAGLDRVHGRRRAQGQDRPIGDCGARGLAGSEQGHVCRFDDVGRAPGLGDDYARNVVVGDADIERLDGGRFRAVAGSVGVGLAVEVDAPG